MPLRLHPLPGTDLRLSTFCYGLGDLFALPERQSDRLLDAFIEAGGNFFDTAHVYSAWLPAGNGLSEIGIGSYLRRRGLAESVTVATKGGHPSLPGYRTVEHYLSAARLAADIDDSLGRLGCDTLPLYYVHRDDPRLPVGAILETLNAEIRRGRLCSLGASNWSLNRLEEAAAYARTHQLEGFVLSQPAWSLAVPKEGTGVGPAVRGGQHHHSRLPVAPYSPTAQGYFARLAPATEGDYASEENRQRWWRVRELAGKLAVAPNQVALAWLLNQPLPVFPILGTKNLAHLEEAMGAEAISFTEEQLVWLNQG